MDVAEPTEKTAAGGPLHGITVLELASFIAAPTAGRLLADFGADVIKVERPDTGDELRQWRLHAGDTSMLWRALGRNKRSITLDLRTPEGRDLALALAERADVVLDGFRPGTLEKWGLGEDALRTANPDVVLVRVSGFGQTGPYSAQPGFGAVAEAMSGLRYVTGDPDRPPSRIGVSLADSLAGLYAVIGALLGLLGRRDGSAAETVDVALYESIFSVMESLIPDYDAFGIVPERSGGRLPGLAPTNGYQATDGWIVVSGNGNAIFARLMELIGRRDLAEDPELAANQGRVRRQDELDVAIGGWVGGRSQAEALAGLQAAGIPSGPIYSAAEIASDPHYAQRGMLEPHRVRVGPGDHREARFPGVVPRLSGQPGAVRWLGPELGEHTEAILDELGVGDDERRRLRTGEVI